MVALVAVLSPALLACGTKWGRQYVLAESGSHDCSGCGQVRVRVRVRVRVTLTLTQP